MIINVKNEYGLKKGFIKYFYYLVLTKLGFFRRYKQIDWLKVKRLIFVCKGNICRSPFAEYYAHQIKNINSTSFGIDSDGKSSADYDATVAAKIFMTDLSSHVSMKQENIFFTEQDLIICMEPAHLKSLEKTTSFNNVQVSLLGLWSDKKNPFIQDPLGLNDIYFRKCFEVIANATDNLIKNMGD